MIDVLMALLLVSQLQNIEPAKKWDVEIVTKKTEEYMLLIKNQPWGGNKSTYC